MDSHVLPFYFIINVIQCFYGYDNVTAKLGKIQNPPKINYVYAHKRSDVL